MFKKSSRKLHRVSLLVVISCLLIFVSCTNEQDESDESIVEKTRHYTFRSLIGVSMGGGATATLGLSRPDMWDFIGIMGTPLSDLMEFQRMLQRTWMGGFCDLEFLEQYKADGGDPKRVHAYCGLYTDQTRHDVKPDRLSVPLAEPAERKD